MDDELNRHMAAAWPKIVAALTAELDQKPRLDAFVPVETLASPLPYRLSGLGPGERYHHVDPSGCLVRLAPAIEPAYDVSVSRAWSPEMIRLAATAASLPGDMGDLGKEARLVERLAVLALLTPRNPADWVKPELGELKKCTAGHPSRYRLIAGPSAFGDDDKTVAASVDEVVAPERGLPPGVGALLVPLYRGPVVHRVVDDLTPVWHRNGAGARIAVSGRFFLDRPETAVAFAARRP